MKKILLGLLILGLTMAAPVGGGNELIKGKLRIDSSGTSMTFSEKMLINGNVTINGGIKATTITANKFIGDGSSLTGISASGGGISTANADLRYISANYTGNVSINGIISATQLKGDGSLLTGVVGGSGLSTANADLRYMPIAAVLGIATSNADVRYMSINAVVGITTTNADLRYASINIVTGITTTNADARYVPLTATLGIPTTNADARYVPLTATLGIPTVNADTRYMSINAIVGITTTNADIRYAPLSSNINNTANTYVGNICFNPYPALDSFSGIYAIYSVSSNTVGTGNAFYFNGSGGLSDAKADTINTSLVCGVAIDAGTGTNKKVLLQGYLSKTGWNWTTGGILYLSASTGGTMTQTQPTAGNRAIKLGWAVSPTTIYFRPSILDIGL